MYVVNVWFGARPTAGVSEKFESAQEALEFGEAYDDCDAIVAVFGPGLGETMVRRPVPGGDDLFWSWS